MHRTLVLAVAVASAIAVSAIAAPARAQSYEQLYSFTGGKHGDYPLSSLVEFRGKLFGTTYTGGSRTCRGGCGTVFSLDLKTGKEKVIHSFQINEGINPLAGLIVIGDLLYGTTYHGAHDWGAVFSVDPSTGVEKTIYKFQNGNDGSQANSALLNVGGTIYGTTDQGGEFSEGTIYSIDLASGAEKVVYAFGAKPDGQSPIGGLVEVDGILYGTTYYGGTEDEGTVFSLNLATSSEVVLHSFGDQQDGYFPYGGVIKVGNKLYGTTSNGGTNDGGTIFEINPNTKVEKITHSFADGDGNQGDGTFPANPLLEVDGMLYGTTLGGGSNGAGTVFAFDPDSRAEKVIYAFQGLGSGDGQGLYDARLIYVDRTLYGTTSAGGAKGKGTIFALTP